MIKRAMLEYMVRLEYMVVDGLGGFKMEDGDYIAPHEEQPVV